MPSQETIKTLNIIQIVLEVIVIIGYICGLTWFFYLFIFWLVIPCAIANMVFSIIKKDKTLPFTITNLVLTFVTFIPVVGTLSSIAGFVMSGFSIFYCSKALNGSNPQMPGQMYQQYPQQQAQPYATTPDMMQGYMPVMPVGPVAQTTPVAPTPVMDQTPTTPNEPTPETPTTPSESFSNEPKVENDTTTTTTTTTTETTQTSDSPISRNE
jgi:hypothetical protein